MANAQLRRSRSSRHRALLRSKRHSRRKPVSIHRSRERFPPELQAPITGELEHQLKQLVTKFGEKKVREALDPLIKKCKWNDWQCVANAIRRIARKNGG